MPGNHPGRRLLRAIAGHPRVPTIVRRLAARIDASQLARRLVRGAFWSLGATVSRALGLAASIVTARILGKEQYGELGVLTATLMTFQVFASAGLGTTATKFVAELRWTDPTRTARILALSTIVSISTGLLATGLLWAFAPVVATYAIHAPALAGPLRIGSLGLVFVTLAGAQTGALAGFEAFRTITRLSVTSGVIGVVVAVGGVWFWGLSGAVWATVLTAAAQWALTQVSLRAHVRSHGIATGLAGWRRELRVLWTYSLPALVQGVMVTPVNWAAAAILVKQPFGYAEMGVLNAANQWFGAVLFLPTAVGGSILPVLSERVGQGDTLGTRKVLRAAIAIDAVVVVPIIVAGSLASPLVMRMYGPEFVSAWPTLVAVLFTAGLIAVTNPALAILQASGRLWLSFGTSVLWAAAYIGATPVLVRWGALGVAGARLLAYVVATIVTARIVVKFLRANR